MTGWLEVVPGLWIAGDWSEEFDDEHRGDYAARQDDRVGMPRRDAGGREADGGAVAQLGHRVPRALMEATDGR